MMVPYVREILQRDAAAILIGGGLQPLGAFAGSTVAQQFGLQFMILAAGLLPMLTSCAALLLPGLKSLNGDLAEQDIGVPGRGNAAAGKEHIPVQGGG